jgi:hypothetical protein
LLFVRVFFRSAVLMMEEPPPAVGEKPMSTLKRCRLRAILAIIPAVCALALPAGQVTVVPVPYNPTGLVVLPAN